ncbi:MAG: DUF4810 domain-containing protein [Candidatus Thiodiazotropha sp.]
METLVQHTAILAVYALVLTGCASAPKPLYHWDSYQTQVYKHFKGEAGPEEQITALEKDIQKARSENTALPPGFHAHLALLYAEIGKEDQVIQELETEKRMFPESSSFMDFLTHRFNKQ